MDFKFRTIELLEIFIQKSKNPENFLLCLTPIIDCIKENLNDSKKQIFIQKYCKKFLYFIRDFCTRIGNLIKKFFEKNLSFSEEVLTNLKECLSHIIFVNAKFNFLFILRSKRNFFDF